MHEFSLLQPVDGSREDGDCLLRSYVGAVLQIVVLSFLLSFQIESGQSPQILFANCLVHCCSTSDSFSIEVSGVCPPIGFGLDITNDHVLNRGW